MSQNETDKGTARSARCTICGEESSLAFRPFCSRRCADVDLARWLTGAYAIPVREDEDEDGDDSAAEMAMASTALDHRLREDS